MKNGKIFNILIISNYFLIGLTNFLSKLRKKSVTSYNTEINILIIVLI